MARARLPADKILVTVGRAPVIEGWGREELALDMDGKFVSIDDQCRTSMRGVCAIGDVTGEPMLAHRAMAQGEMVAEIVAGRNRELGQARDPRGLFHRSGNRRRRRCRPTRRAGSGTEVKVGAVSVQRQRPRDDQARRGGLRARRRARGQSSRCSAFRRSAHDVAELAAAFGLALEMGARLEDIAGTIHAHPTLGEAFHEAALRDLGHALHI